MPFLHFFIRQGVIVHSVNSRADGLSFLFQMELTSANTFVVKVSNFENLNKILSFAGDLKLREAQDILQGNRLSDFEYRNECFGQPTGKFSP